MSDSAFNIGAKPDWQREPLSDLGQLLFDQANAMNQQFQAGLRAGREINKAAHSVLKDCYERAEKDERSRIPTYLHAAIEQLLQMREEEQVNAYAEAGIRRDQRARNEGKPEHDLDTVGRPLKAGS